MGCIDISGTTTQIKPNKIPVGSFQVLMIPAPRAFRALARPKATPPHRYIITVYALNTAKRGTTLTSTAAMTGFMLNKAALAKRHSWYILSVNMMHIVGAGAIGQALAVFLKHSFKPVTLVRRVSSEPMTIKVRLSDRILEAEIPVITLDEVGEGLLLVTAKSFANPQIAAKLNRQTVVFLQNGLNIETVLITGNCTVVS